MQPYDPDEPCPKCEHNAVGTHYHPEGHARFWCYSNEHPKQEHLLRVCQRCGYEWTTATLDAPTRPPLAKEG